MKHLNTIAVILLLTYSNEALPHYKLGVQGAPHNSGGLVIVVIAPGSPAQEIGLRPGDVILVANNRLVSNQAALHLIVSQSQGIINLTTSRGFFPNVFLEGSDQYKQYLEAKAKYIEERLRNPPPPPIFVQQAPPAPTSFPKFELPITQRTSVTGTGDSPQQASMNARINANSISRHYSIVRQNSSGSHHSYICTLVIEYQPE
jgi:hypothetical protein